MKDFFKDKEILITGGTGSLGKSLVALLLKSCNPKGIRIFSRDELKQWNMKQELGKSVPVAYLVGDVRDLSRLHRAMRGVDIVIHAAAMKQVTACEDNPLEAIRTNINGAANVLNTAIDCNVSRVMNVSTDKAVYPINLYGATKLAAEKLFIHGNVYTGGHVTRMSCCRYGNVLASRGSVVKVFEEQIKSNGEVTITHRDATRFFITLPAVTHFLLSRIVDMHGGEIFVPFMKSIKIYDLAIMMRASEHKIKFIGLAKGEKLHEILINENELVDNGIGNFYAISQAADSSIGNLKSNMNVHGYITQLELKSMLAEKI